MKPSQGMILKVEPTLSLKGRIPLPASKSYSIRALMIASCGGVSRIINPSDCDDAKVAMKAARALGAAVVAIPQNQWKVTARCRPLRFSDINVKESGTVLRFLLPLAALHGRKAVIRGEGTLRGRPNTFLLQTLRAMGMDIRGKDEKESVPIRIEGGQLRGGDITINGSLSSQFISALMIACPQLKEDTRLTLTGGEIVSSDYITMTLQVLEKSGIRIRKRGLKTYDIKGAQTFQGLKDFRVPSDYGLAAFLMAAAVLNRSDVLLEGTLDEKLVQADGHIFSFLKKMGVKFQKTSRQIRIQGPFPLSGGDFSLKDCPDLVPIMSVLALFAKTRTRLYDIRHARVKESDRISDLREELLKVGAKVTEKDNELIVDPQPGYHQNCLLDPHQDHRLAMAFAVLGTKLGVCVQDMECVSKSYPGFVRDLRLLGVRAVQFKE